MRQRISKARMLDTKTADEELAALSHERQVMMAQMALAGWQFNFHDVERDRNTNYSYWVAHTPTGERVNSVFRYELGEVIIVAWRRHLIMTGQVEQV